AEDTAVVFETFNEPSTYNSFVTSKLDESKAVGSLKTVRSFSSFISSDCEPLVRSNSPPRLAIKREKEIAVLIPEVNPPIALLGNLHFQRPDEDSDDQESVVSS